MSLVSQPPSGKCVCRICGTIYDEEHRVYTTGQKIKIFTPDSGCLEIIVCVDVSQHFVSFVLSHSQVVLKILFGTKSFVEKIF